MTVTQIVAEPVESRLQNGEGLFVRVLLERVRATGREGNRYVVSGALRGSLDRGATAEHDQVGQRDEHLVAVGFVEVTLDSFEGP